MLCSIFYLRIIQNSECIFIHVCMQCNWVIEENTSIIHFDKTALHWQQSQTAKICAGWCEGNKLLA